MAGPVGNASDTGASAWTRVTAGWSCGIHWMVCLSSSVASRGACPDPAHRFSPKLTRGRLHRAAKTWGCLTYCAQPLVKLCPPLVFQICPLLNQEARINLSSELGQTAPVFPCPWPPRAV